MSTILDRIRREPALVAGLVQSVLALLVAFGLDLSGEQTASILAVTAALLAVLTRQVHRTIAADLGRLRDCLEAG